MGIYEPLIHVVVSNRYTNSSANTHIILCHATYFYLYPTNCFCDMIQYSYIVYIWCTLWQFMCVCTQWIFSSNTFRLNQSSQFHNGANISLHYLYGFIQRVYLVHLHFCKPSHNISWLTLYRRTESDFRIVKFKCHWQQLCIYLIYLTKNGWSSDVQVDRLLCGRNTIYIETVCLIYNHS